VSLLLVVKTLLFVYLGVGWLLAILASTIDSRLHSAVRFQDRVVNAGLAMFLWPFILYAVVADFL
jgi:hypothetical protein